MKATEIQVGGSYYKSMKMQPVELFALTKCTAFQANIWKYIIRYKQKNGKQDIEKAIHYAQLALEFECNRNLDTAEKYCVAEFCAVNEFPPEITTVIICAMNDDYSRVINQCKAIITKEYPDN